jgi:aerobic-type carbon monoxide dehydrogenase small subunit (CoxS/CutS family)
MKATLQFQLNGKSRRVETDPQRPLLDLLREDIQLTGTKYGCGEGQCRACSVLIDGQPVASCVAPAESIEGRRIETIESLSQNGEMHPVQQAFLDKEAMQCGYCVPGMIMTAVALLRNNPSPSKEEIIEAMNGNLCRCCGYVNLIQAVQHAAEKNQP